jgi:hypothetical protein
MSAIEQDKMTGTTRNTANDVEKSVRHERQATPDEVCFGAFNASVQAAA